MASGEGYVKEAFLMKPNLIGLAALEGAYLWSMSRNPRFQRMVRSRRGGF